MTKYGVTHAARLAIRTLSSVSLMFAVACGSSRAQSDSSGSAGTAGTNTAGSSSGGAQQAGSGGAGAGGANEGGSGGSSMGGSSGGPSDPLFPPLIEGCDIPAAHEHADRALAAMLVGFWNGAEQYLNAASPGTGNVTGYWTYAQAFDALLDGAERTGGARYRGLIRAFYDGRDQRGWLVDFFDDETWMTLALMRAYDLTGETLYLDRATALYQDIMAAWDTTCCGEHMGGIWWNRQMEQKATASNAGPVIAGLRLAERTGDAQYLTFARQAYDFWMDHMVERASFAIFDHFTPPDGERFPGALTYNHGLMIGAALELHETTGEAHFLEEAHGFAQYMITVATRPSDVGPLLHDALGDTCDGDCPAWKGIGYRYLALLYQKDPTRAEYREVLVAGAEGLWTLARAADTDFFATNWAGPPPEAGGIEEQGSAAMALNLHALLCGSDVGATLTPGRYEAEEATLDHVALEALYPGFSGFGYVAAFATDEQGVSFDVDLPAAGPRQVTWTYSAAAGTAARSLLVNGAASPTLSFPVTAAWDTWAVVTTTLDLPQGKSTLELRYDESQGSTEPLNLDRIDVVER